MAQTIRQKTILLDSQSVSTSLPGCPMIAGWLPSPTASTNTQRVSRSCRIRHPSLQMSLGDSNASRTAAEAGVVVVEMLGAGHDASIGTFEAAHNLFNELHFFPLHRKNLWRATVRGHAAHASLRRPAYFAPWLLPRARCSLSFFLQLHH